jgi:hypothetical protein
MKCKYCNKECKNANSLRNHERLCKQNPNRQEMTWMSRRREENNPNYGKKGTNDFTKARALGLPDPIVSEETRKKISKAGKGRRHTAETKERLSEIRSLYIEQKGSGGFLDVGWYDVCNINNESFKVRGTWELKYAQWLNAHNILWNRNISFKYQREDGVRRTYLPDFYLPATKEIKEVKGYFSPSDQEKIKLVEQQNNVEIDLLFKEDLEQLGIILNDGVNANR